MKKCINCNYEVTLNFCPNCGLASKFKRIDAKYVIDEIKHLLHIDKGILYTLKCLLFNPGENIRSFLSMNRNRLVKPIVFIVITSLIYTLVIHFFHLEDTYINFKETKKTAITHIFDWIQGHYGYANIIMCIIIAIWTKLFYQKYRYNFFEILVLLCFILGVEMLNFTVFNLLKALIGIDFMFLASVFGIIYYSWAVGQFFDRNKLMSYFKAFVSFLFGMATFMFLAFILGTIINFKNR